MTYESPRKSWAWYLFSIFLPFGGFVACLILWLWRGDHRLAKRCLLLGILMLVVFVGAQMILPFPYGLLHFGLPVILASLVVDDFDAGDFVGSEISETERVKNMVRNSGHISEPAKDVILNAIDTTCQQGYMYGPSIGDSVLAKCLATYEAQAKGE